MRASCILSEAKDLTRHAHLEIPRFARNDSKDGPAGSFAPPLNSLSTRQCRGFLRLENALVACATYLRDMVLPTRLSAVNPYPMSGIATGTMSWSAASSARYSH